MSLQLNQFGQIQVQGDLDLKFNPTSISAVIDVTSAGSLTPGTAVKIVPATKGGVPKVVECAASSDEVFGFINRNQKNQTFDAGDSCEISLLNGGNCMYMTANAAIVQWAVVAIVVASDTVQTSTGGSRDVGHALDAAAASGDLIRVLMLPKSTTT